MANSDNFSKWRRRLWPVHSYELWKLLPLLLMKLCVSFNYTILFSAKDTLVVTAKGSGAEVIPILKGSVVLIVAFLATLLYSRASDFFSRKGLFFATMAPFLFFFALYGEVLYPYRDALTPNQSADALLKIFGESHWHWVAVYRNWMHSLFFIMAEMWGGMVIAVLFWGFANQINKLHEAKRFYALLSVGGHIGTIMAGQMVWYYSCQAGDGDYALTIRYLMSVVTIVSFLILATYWFLQRRCDGFEESSKKAKKAKIGFKESLTVLTRCQNLKFIAVMVIGYGISVNMVEVTWKAIMKTQYPNPNDYQAMMGAVTGSVGAVSFLLALFVSGNTMRVFGWRFAALATPVVLAAGTALFYFFYAAHTLLPKETLWFGISPLLLLVIVGAIHNVSCKAMKYCLFDPTREMAYLSLDDDVKVKGKAAVDVVGARLGKSGSSWIQTFMIELMGTGSILSITHCLAPCVMIAIGFWIYSVRSLGKSVEPRQPTTLVEA